MGFKILLCIPYYSISKTLIADLMDKWSSKKRAFVLANGEIINVPLDVALIMELHVIGKAVKLHKDNIFIDLKRHHISNTEIEKTN